MRYCAILCHFNMTPDCTLTHYTLVTPYGEINFGSILAQVMPCCLRARPMSWSNASKSIFNGLAPGRQLYCLCFEIMSVLDYHTVLFLSRKFLFRMQENLYLLHKYDNWNMQLQLSWDTFNKPISQIPECTCSISPSASFRTEMCTFLFWMEHCGIWNRCILGFVN